VSRAFVKEVDGAAGEDLPELAVSPHRNLVTPAGLAQIEGHLRRLDAELTAARSGGDRATQSRVERDLRYWASRRASAELVPPPHKTDVVRFGCAVRLRTAAGAIVTFRIVGEDEAAPARGLISWVSPLAECLLGAETGDEVPFGGATAEIVAIE
jgi:transcription elongation GreA/GreB family factor